MPIEPNESPTSDVPAAVPSLARRQWLAAAALNALLPAWAADPASTSGPVPTDPADTADTADMPTGPGRISMATLFADHTMGRASLSSDGRYLAAVGDAADMPLAFVLDLTTRKAHSVTPNTREADRWRARIDGHARDVHWIGPDLLVLRTTRSVSLVMKPDGTLIRRLDGDFLQRLADAPDGAERLLLSEKEVLHTVNLRSGARATEAIDLPDTLTHTAFDVDGRLRAATTRKSSRWSGDVVWTQWYRPAGGKWEQLAQEKADLPAWTPMRALEDGTLAVWTRGDRDAHAVFRYDTARRALGELMAGHDTDDILGFSDRDSSTFESVVTGGLKPERIWFDTRWARVQKAVDAALPDTVNVLLRTKHARATPEGAKLSGHVLVHSFSDVDPGRWYSLDTATLHMAEVGVAMPDIDPAAMRPTQAYRYAARDGLKVPAYLTRPAGQGPAPTVVLIHGGPWSRDHWGWDPEVQLLAAQGYAVFQPQFRGSTGFGEAFLRAGYRQWGLAMQDDITDGVQDLIRRGIADPARIAIVGTSYGGYAAMWGLVKTPRLYRCGVSFAGISDLATQMSNNWADDSTAASRRMWRELVGDPDTAKASLDAVSPLRNADRIEAPLLLVHGWHDQRVLREQSESMLKALRRHGKAVEWLPLNTGHGLSSRAVQRRYYRDMLAFLAKHLAPADAKA
ncbi:alpha/beta hydrolase family protein [Roseateles sp. L2-2]|uniref:alpha/beta hydrolase family protein n=1 Tax=Roseateles sp. L2-2 TaxID=3422597 RepID=UPI003D36DBBC